MDTIHVNIKNRGKIFYNGDAEYVSSYNDKGKFDILPQHANFISLIKNYILVKKTNGEIEKIDIKTGVLKNINNDVVIYLDTVRKRT